jgi:uncharacterized protein (TIGR02453 family)
MTDAHFTPGLFGFLRELADHNDRDWFKANKKRYEAVVKDPALQFIADFDPHLRAISTNFRAIPKAVGGSLFRIYRDTRFSKDKTPYKTHTGVHFRHALGKDAHAPGFYLHMEPGSVFCGVGIWMPDNPTLTKIRDGIVADPGGWTAMKGRLVDEGYEWMSHGALKRPPRGYPKDHEHVEDLKLKSFAVSKELDEAQVSRPGFIQDVAGVFAGAAPLASFVCKAVGVPF